MLLDKFIKAGQDFLGCKFPIMCGAMTWVSDYKLIGALGNAGGFGLLAGGHIGPVSLSVLLQQILFEIDGVPVFAAGQSVGLVDKIKPIQGIIDEMVNDAESELQRLNKIFWET